MRLHWKNIAFRLNRDREWVVADAGDRGAEIASGYAWLLNQIDLNEQEALSDDPEALADLRYRHIDLYLGRVAEQATGGSLSDVPEVPDDYIDDRLPFAGEDTPYEDEQQARDAILRITGRNED